MLGDEDRLRIREAQRKEVLLKDGSVHNCEGAAYKPLMGVGPDIRYHCTICGRVFSPSNGVFRETGRIDLEAMNDPDLRKVKAGPMSPQSELQAPTSEARPKSLREQFMKELGLVPPEIWAARAVTHNMQRYSNSADHPKILWDPDTRKELMVRNSGRTTTILFGCLVTMHLGKPVRFAATYREWEYSCVSRVREWADQLSIDPDLIIANRVWEDSARFPGQDNRVNSAKLYSDHPRF